MNLLPNQNLLNHTARFGLGFVKQFATNAKFKYETNDFVKIVEVGARDGLQNEKNIIPTEKKIELINRLSETGLTAVEATSFVSPEAIPQLSDSAEVMAKIKRNPKVSYPVLVPTRKYCEKAIEAGVQEVAVFTSPSETFNKKNINCSVEVSIKRISDIMKVTKERNVKVRGYVSCVAGCPYEGFISPGAVTELSQKLLDLGCYEISLGDTIGVGTPGSISNLLTVISKSIPSKTLALHCHDTFGQALANVLCGLEFGIRTFDSSIAGLGGCPYARGASGNVATEDLLYMLDGIGVNTGVDLNKIIEISKWFSTEVLKKPPKSKVAMAKFGAACFPGSC